MNTTRKLELAHNTAYYRCESLKSLIDKPREHRRGDEVRFAAQLENAERDRDRLFAELQAVMESEGTG